MCVLLGELLSPRVGLPSQEEGGKRMKEGGTIIFKSQGDHRVGALNDIEDVKACNSFVKC